VTADEIRVIGIVDVASATQLDISYVTMVLLREIAAQLAELVEHVKAVDEQVFRK